MLTTRLRSSIAQERSLLLSIPIASSIAIRALEMLRSRSNGRERGAIPFDVIVKSLENPYCAYEWSVGCFEDDDTRVAELVCREEETEGANEEERDEVERWVEVGEAVG